jgi:hypothetical protein
LVREKQQKWLQKDKKTHGTVGIVDIVCAEECQECQECHAKICMSIPMGAGNRIALERKKVKLRNHEGLRS